MLLIDESLEEEEEIKSNEGDSMPTDFRQRNSCRILCFDIPRRDDLRWFNILQNESQS